MRRKIPYLRVVRELVIAGLTVFIFSNIISWIRQPKEAPSVLPTEQLRLIDGSSYHFKKGRPVVIRFWATWCRVCKMESGNIDRIAQAYDVVTIAVDSGSDADIQSYMKREQVHFKVYNDKDGRWPKRFGVEVFPTTFIYDAKGMLRFSEVGYTTTAGLIGRIEMIK